MKQFLFNAALVALMMNANADTFRLRMPTVAERIGANGKTIGETTLPAGAVLTGDVKQPSVPNEKLVASAMSPAMFEIMKPKDPVVFNAEVRLNDVRYPPRWASPDEFISFEIRAYNQRWSGMCPFTGYLEKSSAAALKLIPIIQDGAWHNMLLKIRYHDVDTIPTNVDILDGKEIKTPFVF